MAIRAALPPSLTLDAVASLDLDEFAQHATSADILLVGHRRVDAVLLALAPQVRFGAGYDNLDVAALVASLLALRLMRAVPPPPEAERPSLARVLEGLRYARSRPELLGTYGVDMVAMFFGMPTALFPALAPHYGGPARWACSMPRPPWDRCWPR